MKNLINNLPDNLPEEIIETLTQNEHIRIEQIVSTGHSSPDDFWYDQAQSEFVIILKGEAKLQFEDGAELMHMKPGDYLLIPAHKKHRIEWTTPNEPTVWLAIFFDDI